MSDGMDYELFVQGIYQALMASEEFSHQKNIEVVRNKFIVDRSGVERQFDLYWEYELAGVNYKTVIECKDYASRIGIEKIDALIGKLHDIPGLRPVFATKTGYQSGAKAKAQANGIDLLVVREQNDEDWKDKVGGPLVKQLIIHMHALPSPRVTQFRPHVDVEWLEKNGLTLGEVGEVPVNEIYIEHISNHERYSLYELVSRLASENSNFGSFVHTECFEEAYLVHSTQKFKIRSYEMTYIIPDPIQSEIVVDYSKQLIGVIEYIHKEKKTAIFKDKVIPNWGGLE